MKYYISLFFLLCFTNIFAQQSGESVLHKSINLKRTEAGIKEWFGVIENTGVVLAYNPVEIPLEKIVVINQKTTTIAALLHAVLGRGFELSAKENKIIIVKVPVKYVLSGFVKEQGSQEALKGATISIANTSRGAVTNTYGFYSISLPEGPYEIQVSYIGYTTQLSILKLTEDLNVDFFLKGYDTVLTNVKIATSSPDLHIKEGGLYRFNLQKKDKQPQLLGVDDPIKRLQFLPGVNGGTSSLSPLGVRGGNADNNLVLLDGVPIYNYNHFSGLLSIFNTDALKSVDFYKGGFPARYNGRLSSVIDIGMREGNMEKYHGGLSVDFATASVFGEGPLIKNKSSFLISARRSWADLLSQKIRDYFGVKFSLHDINLKLNYKVGHKDHFYISAYKGADIFRDPFSPKQSNKILSWSNRMAALRWNHVFSNRLFSNTSFSISDFKNSLGQYFEADSGQAESFNPNKTLDYKMEEYILKTDFDYYSEIGHMRMGHRMTKSDFTRPYIRADFSSWTDDQKSSNWSSSLHWMTYYENEIKIKEKITLLGGLNYVVYKHQSNIFQKLQSRLQLNYTPVGNHTFFASFSEMGQFFHQLSINTLSLPYEFRMPATKNMKPATSRLYELGYRANLSDRQDVVASVYYNKTTGFLRYRPQQSVTDEFLAEELKNQILTGLKRAIGFEVLYSLKKNIGDFVFSYGLSGVNEKFSEINNGQYYPSSNNITNALKCIYTWHINQRNHLTASATYNSGQYVTAPEYRIPDIDDAIGLKRPGFDNGTFISARYNNYKLPDNYQLNLGYVLEKKSARGITYAFKSGIYNVFGKSTPLSIMIERENNSFRLAQTVLPHFLPYISYSIRF